MQNKIQYLLFSEEIKIISTNLKLKKHKKIELWFRRKKEV